MQTNLTAIARHHRSWLRVSPEEWRCLACKIIDRAGLLTYCFVMQCLASTRRKTATILERAGLAIGLA